MDYEVLSLPAVGLLVLSSTILLVNRDWRWGIAALGLQYLGVFVLVAVPWPADLAVVKLVGGWMAASILGTTQVRQDGEEESRAAWPSGRLFRLLAATLIMLLVASLAERVEVWIPSQGINQVLGGLLLICMGLLHLGLRAHPLGVVVGLLTILSGFEILYAGLETSTLVAGLLAVVTLGIALAGAYLLSVPSSEERP